MRWQMGRRSDNVEDVRGRGMPIGGLRIPGCLLVVIVLVSLATGHNPLTLLSAILENQPTTQAPEQPSGAPPQHDEQSDFAAVVLADTEDTWTSIFAKMNRTYEPPKLVLFSDYVGSSCGTSSSAVGPFYCPMDDKVYIDLTFFNELDQRFGAPGDFARAYVIAHEVGHHVQNLLQISERVRSMQERGSEQDANSLSVGLELQADCLAGVWAYYAQHDRNLLEPGDTEEGMNAAAAVGDDRLQKSAGRSVSPESWTHGSSEMRVRWFRTGLQSGDPSSCDTFQVASLRP